MDPIDGTRNYLRGIPVWASLIALEKDGEIAVGVVSAPALHRRWWATRGGGAWAGGEPIHVSGVRRLEEAVVSFTRSAEDLPGTRELARRSWHARGFGDFWGHMLVAEGAADANVDAPGVTIWDLAAVQVVVEEAGGRFTDLERRAASGRRQRTELQRPPPRRRPRDARRLTPRPRPHRGTRLCGSEPLATRLCAFRHRRVAYRAALPSRGDGSRGPQLR